jgi:3-polyprenyl-4-hydroxybenzoate decarboxylase
VSRGILAASAKKEFMSYKSLGDFIAAIGEAGDLKIIHGAALDLDVGCLTELAYEADGPMLLFDVREETAGSNQKSD